MVSEVYLWSGFKVIYIYSNNKGNQFVSLKSHSSTILLFKCGIPQWATTTTTEFTTFYLIY